MESLYRCLSEAMSATACCRHATWDGPTGAPLFHTRDATDTPTRAISSCSLTTSVSLCAGLQGSVCCVSFRVLFKDTTQRTTAEGYRLLVFTMNRLGLSTVCSLEYTPLWPWSGLGARPLGPRFITSQADIKKYPPLLFWAVFDRGFDAMHAAPHTAYGSPVYYALTQLRNLAKRLRILA